MSQSSALRSSQSSASVSLPNFVWLGAGALVVYLFTRKSKAGVSLAAATGAAAVRLARSQAAAKEYTAITQFLLNATPEQAYSLWRQFESLPRFMSHLKSVEVLDERRSRWTALGPLDEEVSWDAEITIDTPNEQISWQSLPGSAVTNSGSVRFVPELQGRGTAVHAEIKYSLPLGPGAKALITGFGKNPDFVLKEDVRRFKSLLEAGEAPTTVGQSHGPRDVSGQAKEFLFRETSNHPEPQAAAAEASEPVLQTA